MSDITTWADGYGVWHARVPNTANGARVAKRAILAELRQRGTVNASAVTLRLSSWDGQTATYQEEFPGRFEIAPQA